MAKITVLVEKDDMGKLWNFLIGRENVTAKTSRLKTPILLVHKNQPCIKAETNVQNASTIEEPVKIAALPLAKAVQNRNSKRR